MNARRREPSKVMRWDSPLVLAVVGTVSIHTLLFIGADAIDVYSGPRRPAPAPQFDSFEIQMPPPPPVPEAAPPQPAPPAPQALPPPSAPVRNAPAQITKNTASRPTAAAVPNETPPPANTPPDPAGGGAPVYTMADLGPAARGVAVASGTPSTGKTGRGGTGNGSGTGTGDGAGSGAAPVAMSVAAIKTRAMPKGDYSYFDDYPAEAKQLGIAGEIKVRLLVSAEGKVVKRTLLKGLGHGLDELAMQKAASMEFSPALDANDRPVASIVVWTFNMQLR